MHIIVKYGFFYHLLSNDAQELKGHVEILSSLVDESKAYSSETVPYGFCSFQRSEIFLSVYRFCCFGMAA
jgi:hypothetical protein